VVTHLEVNRPSFKTKEKLDANFEVSTYAHAKPVDPTAPGPARAHPPGRPRRAAEHGDQAPQPRARARKVARYAGFTLLGLVTFVFAFQLAFPFGRVKQRMIDALSDQVRRHDRRRSSAASSRAGCNIKALSIRTRPAKADDVATTFYIEQLEVDLGILALLRGTVAITSTPRSDRATSRARSRCPSPTRRSTSPADDLRRRTCRFARRSGADERQPAARSDLGVEVDREPCAEQREDPEVDLELLDGRTWSRRRRPWPAACGSRAP